MKSGKQQTAYKFCCMGKCESTEAGEFERASVSSESNPENNIYEPKLALYTSPAVESCYIFDGEFDPGSGPTLAACVTHASRTQQGDLAAWRTGEEHVRNLALGGG